MSLRMVGKDEAPRERSQHYFEKNLCEKDGEGGKGQNRVGPRPTKLFGFKEKVYVGKRAELHQKRGGFGRKKTGKRTINFRGEGKRKRLEMAEVPAPAKKNAHKPILLRGKKERKTRGQRDNEGVRNLYTNKKKRGK